MNIISTVDIFFNDRNYLVIFKTNYSLYKFLSIHYFSIRHTNSIEKFVFYFYSLFTSNAFNSYQNFSTLFFIKY